MVSKEEKERVQMLLTEAVTVMCKNGLNYSTEGFTVEGILGITLLHNDQVILVNINETINGNGTTSNTTDSHYLSKKVCNRNKKQKTATNSTTSNSDGNQKGSSSASDDNASIKQEPIEENCIQQCDGAFDGRLLSPNPPRSRRMSNNLMNPQASMAMWTDNQGHMQSLPFPLWSERENERARRYRRNLKLYNPEKYAETKRRDAERQRRRRENWSEEEKQRERDFNREKMRIVREQRRNIEKAWKEQMYRGNATLIPGMPGDSQLISNLTAGLSASVMDAGPSTQAPAPGVTQGSIQLPNLAQLSASTALNESQLPFSLTTGTHSDNINKELTSDISQNMNSQNGLSQAIHLEHASEDDDVRQLVELQMICEQVPSGDEL